MAALAVVLVLVNGAAAHASLALLKPTPDSLATFSGNGGYSADGLGQNTTGGTVQADVPANSTVVQAYLYGTYSSAPTIDATNGVIDFDGTQVQLTALPDVAPGCCQLNAARADVTSQVAAKVGSGGAITDFVIGNDPAQLEGVGLVVIYSNPDLPEVTIAVLDGGAKQDGDSVTFLFADPLDLTAPGFGAQLSLGSGFSYQGGSGPGTHVCGGGQFSIVDVNAQRLTSCAGNYDDGQGNNGGLITVGGVGDSTDNPTDPNSSDTGTDDELYNLVPLLKQGDTQLKIDTSNPSQDDNLFLAVVDITARARATTLDCSDPANAGNPECQPPPPTPPASTASSSETSTTSTSTATATPAAPPPAVTTPPATTAAATVRAAVSGAPRGCASSTFSVRVRVGGTATRVRVRVLVDGKVVVRSTRRSFNVDINAKRLKAGRHRVVVVASATGARTSTKRFSFTRCAPVRPTLTG